MLRMDYNEKRYLVRCWCVFHFVCGCHYFNCLESVCRFVRRCITYQTEVSLANDLVYYHWYPSYQINLNYLDTGFPEFKGHGPQTIVDIDSWGCVSCDSRTFFYVLLTRLKINGDKNYPKSLNKLKSLKKVTSLATHPILHDFGFKMLVDLAFFVVVFPKPPRN